MFSKAFFFFFFSPNTKWFLSPPGIIWVITTILPFPLAVKTELYNELRNPRTVPTPGGGSQAAAVGEEYSMRLLTLRNVHVKAASRLHLQPQGGERERPAVSQGTPSLSAAALKAFTKSSVPHFVLQK